MKALDLPQYKEIYEFVIDRFSALFKTSIERSKALIKKYFMDRLIILVDKLAHYPEYQKALLDFILEENLDLNKQFNDDSVIVTYIRLLCKSHEQSDHDRILYLLQNFKYPLDECIKVCAEYKVKEPWAYLETKRGGYPKALELHHQILEDTIQDYSRTQDASLLNKLDEHIMAIYSILELCHDSNQKVIFDY